MFLSECDKKLAPIYKGSGLQNFERDNMHRFSYFLILSTAPFYYLVVFLILIGSAESHAQNGPVFVEKARVHNGYYCIMPANCAQEYTITPNEHGYATSADFVAGYCDRIGEIDGFKPPENAESACFVGVEPFNQDSDRYVSRGFSCSLTGKIWNGGGWNIYVPLLSMQTNGIEEDDAACTYSSCPIDAEWNEEESRCECSNGEPYSAKAPHCGQPQCQSPTTYNDNTDLCEKECPVGKPWSATARDCVAPPEPQNCSNEAGNPINFFTGHKLQREPVLEANGDFPLTFSWLYNSFGNHHKTGAGYSVGSKVLEGGGIALVGEIMLHTEPPLTGGAQRISLPLDSDPAENYQGGVAEHWRHNHSYFLAHYTLPDGTTSRLIAYRPNGSDLHFVEENGEFVALANRNWRMTKELDANSEQIGWILRVDGRIERYDTAGRILRVENEQDQGISYTYGENGIRQTAIADDSGNSISLSYTDETLTQITRNDGSVYQFSYNDNGLLQSITFPGSNTPQRIFRYEDSRFPNALTGVTDEAGKVYSTYAYDDQGRAIRTEHNSGAESVDVAYVDDNTRRLTNALGKQTTYRYSDVGGTKRITTVQGEASANCAAANKAYTYDANGFVASEADWEGNVTTYTRDNLGRELTRTEGAGTPSSRTITTEWHTTLNVPVKVTSAESTTDIIYDSKGQVVERQIMPVGN